MVLLALLFLLFLWPWNLNETNAAVLIFITLGTQTHSWMYQQRIIECVDILYKNTWIVFHSEMTVTGIYIIVYWIFLVNTIDVNKVRSFEVSFGHTKLRILFLQFEHSPRCIFLILSRWLRQKRCIYLSFNNPTHGNCPECVSLYASNQEGQHIIKEGVIT